MKAYNPWATLPGERATWERARKDLMVLEDQIVRVIALSRANRDVEAQQAMQSADARFGPVSSDLDQLISINDRAATDSLTQTSMIRVKLVLMLLGIGLGALVGTMLVGRWAVSQVARREEEMTAHASALEERNRELDAFAGRVAHDIRGPLGSISLATARLTPKVPQERKSTDILRRGVQRMEALVDDLLTLAQLEVRVIGRCDPAAVADQIREDFATRIEDEKGALRVAVDHAQVPCSEGLLRQALANLTENAVKYRRPDVAPQVEISGTATAGAYDLRVSDNGVGMSAEEAERVFEPFYRSPRTQTLPGTGLGLSIVKRVVEASGGTIALQTGEERGSTFVLHLPLANTLAAPALK
jgi:signal transduction histidine kinase